MADELKNDLQFALLEDATVMGQLGKRWRCKNQSDHGAAGMEEMLSQMVCSSLGQDFSPAEEVSQY